MSAEWPSIADLLVEGEAHVALLGAPLEAGSVTPGRCDLAPAAVRQALKRIGTYDLDTGLELTAPIRDLGDLPVAGLMPADAFSAIRDGAAAATSGHRLTILLGGNNAVTRPAAHGLGVPLEEVGLITLDAHFDLRSTDQGPATATRSAACWRTACPARISARSASRPSPTPPPCTATPLPQASACGPPPMCAARGY
jgi:arginase family enzyme